MSAKIIGFITDIFPVETKPNFAKQVLWIKQPDTERYPQHWQVEVHNSDIDRLRLFKKNQKVEAEVEIRGYKYKKPNGEEAIITSLKLVGMAVIK
jgi:RPA family protein